MGTLTQPEPPRPAAERILDATSRRLTRTWPAGGRAVGAAAALTGDLLRKATHDDVATQASALTFTAFLALFPAVLLATSIAGFWLHGRGQESIDKIVTSIPGLDQLISQQGQAIVNGRYASGAAGIIGLLWAASALSNRARRSLGTIFGQWESAVHGRAWALLVTIALGLGLVIAVGLAGVITGLLHRDSPGTLAALAGEIVLLGALVGAFLLVYRLLIPGSVAFRELLPGALLCAVGWTILQGLGSLFVARAIDRWSALYGTIASVFGVLLFLRIAAWMFLAGAELSAVRRVAQDG